MSQDATRRILVGPLGREMARFGTPLALGMGLQTTFNLVDAYLIARLEPEVAGPALGAIGICDQVAALGTIVSYGFSVATASLVSQAWGRGDRDGARRIASQSVLLVVAFGLLLALLGGAGARFLLADAVGAKGRVAELGGRYLTVVMGGSVTIFLLLHLATLMRAVGSSKTPVSFLVLANALNLFLAVLFVYGPGEAPPVFGWGPPIAEALHVPRLELLGAGIATVLARCVALVPLGFAAASRLGFFESRPKLKPELPTMLEIGRLGWPSSAQLVVRMLAMLLTHALVARAFTTELDQSATTALGIVFRFETMALFVGIGWGSAAQTFVGQNLGASNVERAKQSGYYAALYNSLMMAALALGYALGAEHIVRFFDDDPNVIRIALDYFRWVGPSYIGLGLGIVLGSAMQGAGASLRALLLDTAVVLCFQVPASIIVLLTPRHTLTHVWLVVALTYVMFALVYAMSYRRGRFLWTMPA